MEPPMALNIAPLNAPHKDLEWLPLGNRDFQIQDLTGNENHLQEFCEIRNSHKSNSDLYGIWESNLPRYYLPSVNIFPDIIRLCCANYEPVQRAVKSPSGTVLFYITPESIMKCYTSNPFCLWLLCLWDSCLSRALKCQTQR